MSNVVRRKLRDAFAALRRQGYWTLEGDICCQSCGLAMVPDDKAETYCFYHCQDEMGLEETGDCYLSWDSIPSAKCAIMRCASSGMITLARGSRSAMTPAFIVAPTKSRPATICELS